MPDRLHDPSGLMPPERDACAIICYVNKEGRPTHGNVQRTIEALVKMGHRAGEINGEGDGCGILTDIPRPLWGEVLSSAGHPQELADHPGFAVGHLLLDRDDLAQHPGLQDAILQRIREEGLDLLAERHAPVRSEVLAPKAREGEPLFWQIAMLSPEPAKAPAALFELQVVLEREFPVHVASLSTVVAAYKVHGAPELLSRYYPELKRREFQSSITIGHSRYSTNTLPTVLRAQPFSLLGHNGEINTIARLREEARMLGIDLPAGGSDSQDLNRTLEGLIFRHGLTLFEAMELVFPPIFSIMDRMAPEPRAMYGWFRRFLAASAQGPAAIIARHSDRCVFSVDAMGLRPLWVGETDRYLFASSELGVVPHEEIMGDPKPLAPGEKVGVRLAAGQPPQVLEHHELRSEVHALFRRRTNLAAQAKAVVKGQDLLPLSPPLSRQGRGGDSKVPPHSKLFARSTRLLHDNFLSALGWKNSDLQNLREMARSGQEPIASLGYDGPLAALSLSRQNLSDYFKEQVAVVTNPAIDREREAEHFSTRVYIGPRPALRGISQPAVELALPLLLGGGRTDGPSHDEAIAASFGTCTLQTLLSRFGRGRCRVLSCTMGRDESLRDALARLATEATGAARRGARILVLDDSAAFAPGRSFLDPYLAVAEIHKGLKETVVVNGESLRRRASLVVRSGALRTLHDLIFALGMGADALCPYLMWEEAAREEDGVKRLLGVLGKGLEKVISTMGTHEIGGYGKYFASIGLCRHLAEIFETPNFCGSGSGGLTLERLEAENRSRSAVARSRAKQPVPAQFRLYPRIWRMVGQVAKMEESYADLSRLIQGLEGENPLAIRHLLDFRFTEELMVDPDEVDATVGGHALPILFS
ncbi:MAG TPA: glutamate synthase central domain-containing protein, partial [Geobacteraceae bacterium]|nr:glutamate synthase central domain-containing protein [Geobacteraceae bacterium]